MTQADPGQTTPPPEPPAQPPPQPPPPPSSGGLTVRNWQVISHLSALAGFLTAGVGSVVGPLLVWLIKGKEDPQIEVHAKAALNFQISMLIYGVAAGALMFVGIGFVLLPAVAIFDLVCVILAAVKASEGQLFKYPLSLNLIK